MNSPIGPCSLEELPKPYRDAFSTGMIHRREGTFIPMESDRFTQIITTLIMSPMILVPGMMIIYVNYYLLFKPFEILSFIERVFSESWGVIALTIGLIALLIVLVIYMGKTAYRLIKDIILSRREKKNRAEDVHNYGLLMNEDCLVARWRPVDDEKECVLFPRKSINKIAREYVRVQAEKPKNVLKIVIYYQTDDGKKWHHVLSSRLLLGSDSEIHSQIKRWAGPGKS